MTKDGANTETQIKNIDYDFTEKTSLAQILIYLLTFPSNAHVLAEQC